MTHRALVCVFLVLASASVAVQQSKTLPVADLSVVTKALRTGQNADLSKSDLVGKVYAGAVVVKTIRLNPDGSALLDTEPAGDVAEGAPIVLLRFIASQNDARVMDLKRDQVVRVRATLSKLSASGRARSAEFSDVIIEPGK